MGSNIAFQIGNGDVMVNATEMAKPFGKRPIDWLRLPSSEVFIARLSEVRRSHITQLVRTSKGNFADSTEQGTWMHEDVALEFARWLSPAFAIWCNDRIKELMTTGSVSHNHHISFLTHSLLFVVRNRLFYLMIHEAFRKAVIAYRYYQIIQPEKNYNNEQARKRFNQDKNINLKTLKKVIHTVFKEQSVLFNKDSK